MAKHNAERPTGAVQSKTRLRDRLDAWLAHHSTSAIDSLLKLLNNPGASLITWLVVAIALALPTALLLALLNLQQLGHSWEDANQISVFLQPQTTEEQALKLQQDWTTQTEISRVTYISPAEGLAEFRDYSGLGRLIDSLDHNPLPPVLLVQPTNLNNADINSLREYLLSSPLVADVKIDMQWVKRLQHLMSLAQRLVLGLAGLLALGLVLTIGNTLRLAIENRREEILVVKLVGGTDAYVRRPFLYTGLWYGAGGGLLAAVVLALGILWLRKPVTHLADLYYSTFQLKGLGLMGSLQLILLGGFLGLLGAWLAVGRHLGRIQPR